MRSCPIILWYNPWHNFPIHPYRHLERVNHMVPSRSKKRVTLQDVARATGYSATAVSRALKGMPDISPEATRRIRKAAEEMHYVANQSAVSLRYGRSNTITAILTDLVNPFFTSMSAEIQSAAQEKGYTLTILSSQGTAGLELELVRQAVSRHTDGILLFPSCESEKTIQYLEEMSVPFVLLAHDFPPYEADCVVINDELAGFMATEHLIQAGCRNPAFVSASADAPSFEGRRNGYANACIRYGLSENAGKIVIIPDLNASAIHRKDTLLAATESLRRLRDSGVDGLFLFCDVEAWCVAEILRLQGFRPDTFSITSIDNIAGNILFPAPLCSADCSIETLAKTGVELLSSRILGDTSEPKKVVSPVHMVCNGTCRLHRRDTSLFRPSLSR